MTVTTRALVLVALVALTGVYLGRMARAEEVPLRQSLSLCPTVISSWSGKDLAPLDEQTLAVLGADEYLNRVYMSPAGGTVGLYIGYYGSQRQGDTMHSPLNCLPGAGWTPVEKTRIRVPVDAVASNEPSEKIAIEVNRFVIEKGLDRLMVIYWYQSHGRVVASEYWGRFYMMADAIRQNRTDGALVRVISPIVTTEADAETQAVEFVRVLFPLLHAYLPS